MPSGILRNFVKLLLRQFGTLHLVQSECPLEGPVPDDHRDVVDAGFPQHVVDLVRGEARNIFTIDLQNLVTKSEIIQACCLNPFKGG